MKEHYKCPQTKFEQDWLGSLAIINKQVKLVAILILQFAEYLLNGTWQTKNLNDSELPVKKLSFLAQKIPTFDQNLKAKNLLGQQNSQIL